MANSRSSSRRPKVGFYDKAEFDARAGAYRDLGTGIIHLPGDRPQERAQSLAQEWYEKTVASRRRTITRHVGKRIVTEEDYVHLTAGLVIGAGALVLGWEVGQSIAHGLAGLDPLTWVGDIEDWIEGVPKAGNVAASSVGGWIDAHIVELISPTQPAAAGGSSIGGLPGAIGAGLGGILGGVEGIGQQLGQDLSGGVPLPAIGSGGSGGGPLDTLGNDVASASGWVWRKVSAPTSWFPPTL